MAERIPQTWTAFQEHIVGAFGATAEDELVQAALHEYRGSLIDHRNIRWVHGGGVGGWDVDPYEIMTDKLIPEDDSACSDTCHMQAEIVGPDGEEAIVLSCRIGGFATKKAALEQEARCADCLAGKAVVLMTNVVFTNTQIGDAKAGLEEEETRHAARVRSLNGTLQDLL
jgi:hypothetical protein